MHPVRLPPSVKRIRDNPVWAAFDFAFQGILYATRTQRNMRVHLIAGSLALFAALELRLERAYVAVVVIVIVLVIALELLNTAVEAIVDLMTANHHPLAKIAKDASAGAVLVASMGALIVGYLAFYEGVTAGGAKVSAALAGVPRNYAFVALAIVGIATIFLKAFAARRGTPLQGGAVSGHAALAFAGATLIALLSQTLVIALLAYFLAFLVSQSRVEAGIHSFAEVVAGGVVGAGITVGLYLLVRV
ncbi:MAG: diacylglycerol kinase [Candidatus Eremiobacteraeota bacterium]|nr:diacylglycerol kinase [Candidatus Eremiobacteraeota bacterium]